MRLVIAAVGRARNAPEDAIAKDYLGRALALGRSRGFTTIELIAVPASRAASAPQRQAEEARQLSARLPAKAYAIVLDEKGRGMSSESFARHLASLRDAGTRDLAFLIGGPDGLAQPLLEQARERLAFGPQTWPHLLARAMLSEQIYRALTILTGHPYHRSS